MAYIKAFNNRVILIHVEPVVFLSATMVIERGVICSKGLHLVVIPGGLVHVPPHFYSFFSIFLSLASPRLLNSFGLRNGGKCPVLFFFLGFRSGYDNTKFCEKKKCFIVSSTLPPQPGNVLTILQ